MQDLFHQQYLRHRQNKKTQLGFDLPTTSPTKSRNKLVQVPCKGNGNTHAARMCASAVLGHAMCVCAHCVLAGAEAAQRGAVQARVATSEVCPAVGFLQLGVRASPGRVGQRAARRAGRLCSWDASPTGSEHRK